MKRIRGEGKSENPYIALPMKRLPTVPKDSVFSFFNDLSDTDQLDNDIKKTVEKHFKRKFVPSSNAVKLMPQTQQTKRRLENVFSQGRQIQIRK